MYHEGTQSTVHDNKVSAMICSSLLHSTKRIFGLGPSLPRHQKAKESQMELRVEDKGIIRRDADGYTVHEKPPELIVNADTEGVQVQAKPSKLQVIAYPHLQGFHPFEHTAVLGPHSPPVNIGPNAPPVHIGPHVPAVHLSPRVPSLHFGTNAPLLHVRPHSPFIHMTPPLPAVHALTGPPVHVVSPSTVYHQPPIVFHQPHFGFPGYGYGGGFYGRSDIPEQDYSRQPYERSRRDVISQGRFRRQWYGWHPFPHTVNVGPHTPPIHVGPHYPPVHIGPHVPAVHIGPHVPVINVPSHVPAIHVRPHVQAIHLGPPVPIVNAGNHFPAVHVTSPPTIYHRPPIVIHQPHIIHPYGQWKRDRILKPEQLNEEAQEEQGSEDNGEQNDMNVSLRSLIESSPKVKRQMFSNANSGPNGDSVIFVHPNQNHGGGDSSNMGFNELGLGGSNPLEGEMSNKGFGGDNYSPSSFNENAGGNAESLASMAGGSLGGQEMGGTNSFADNGGMNLGGLGGQNSMSDLAGASLGGGSMGGGSMSGLAGLGGGGGAQMGGGTVITSGEPSHFQVDDKAAEIEVNANPAGVKVIAKPASLQVVAKPGLQQYGQSRSAIPLFSYPYMGGRSPLIGRSNVPGSRKKKHKSKINRDKLEPKTRNQITNKEKGSKDDKKSRRKRQLFEQDLGGYNLDILQDALENEFKREIILGAPPQAPQIASLTDQQQSLGLPFPGIQQAYGANQGQTGNFMGLSQMAGLDGNYVAPLQRFNSGNLGNIMRSSQAMTSMALGRSQVSPDQLRIMPSLPEQMPMASSAPLVRRFPQQQGINQNRPQELVGLPMVFKADYKSPIQYEQERRPHYRRAYGRHPLFRRRLHHNYYDDDEYDDGDYRDDREMYHGQHLGGSYSENEMPNNEGETLVDTSNHGFGPITVEAKTAEGVRKSLGEDKRGNIAQETTKGQKRIDDKNNSIPVSSGVL
ncbi:hypothetical protein QZH41_003850 [Actinostola sp. cb2023]|nr:hypothetical protein QZH41_003850 [Actinostola sp. cb2023]